MEDWTTQHAAVSVIQATVVIGVMVCINSEKLDQVIDMSCVIKLLAH